LETDVTFRQPVTFLLLVLALLAGLVLSLGVGAVALPPGQVFAALTGSPLKESHTAIIWDFRLARVLLVSLCGAALAAAGVGFQGLFRNPLADPYIVGASSGAALGAALSVVLAQRSGMSVPIGAAAFIGALCAVFAAHLLAEASGFGSIAALLLSGAALGSMLSAAASLLLLLNDEALREVFSWLLGGFGGRSWPQLSQTALIAPIGMAVLWLMARPLDALAAGEDSARALGLDLRWARFVIITGASLATAAAVSAGGIIGFVGLIAPHLARHMFGAGHAKLIPAAMLVGALLLLFADDLARGLLPPLELPVGVLTALLGGPFFFIIFRARGCAA
jgi:iron complex transport system permease protein